MSHEAAAHDSHGHGDHGSHPHVNYFSIFIALCVCTLLSIVFDLFKSPSLKWVIISLVMAVACAKAMFVLRYFMHLKFEGNWKFIVLLPTTILAIGLIFALAPDIGLHYYQPDVPQNREQVPAAAPAAEHKDDHGHGH
jgi:cytochrome c oxidase subunit 4